METRRDAETVPAFPCPRVTVSLPQRPLSPGGFGSSNGRIGGCPADVVSLHAIAVGRVGRQVGVRIGSDVLSHRRNPSEVRAGRALAALDVKAGFVARVVGPRQVDLALGDGSSGQVGGRGWWCGRRERTPRWPCRNSPNRRPRCTPARDSCSWSMRPARCCCSWSHWRSLSQLGRSRCSLRRCSARS